MEGAGSPGRRLRWGALVFAVLSGTAPVARADVPLWELGAGLAGLSAPDYRGAEESLVHLAPFPYLIYRGERLRVERTSVRGILLEGERYELDMSFYGAPPVDSAGNSARAGMEDLDTTVEAGPALNFYLQRDAGRGRELKLSLAVRAAVAVSLQAAPRDVGWLVQPRIQYRCRDDCGRGWDLKATVGPWFGSRRYHQYYYGVPESAATGERPAWDAPAGYGGFGLALKASRRFPHAWFGLYLRYDDLHGVAYEESPLFRSRGAFTVGAALAWVFRESERQVPGLR